MNYLLTGAQGTGKTSLMNALSVPMLKLQGITRKTISENKLDINRDSNNRSQKAIFDAYEHELSSHSNYIAERSLIDVYAYTLHQVKEGKCSKEIAQDQYQRLRKYIECNPNAIYFYLPVEFELEDDGTRSLDKEFQKEIDNSILCTLLNEHCKYFVITGSVEQRAQRVQEIIENTKK
jgi:nicotinamide riboside kinase